MTKIFKTNTTKRQNKLLSGQSLFEILFAFAIMAIMIVAIVGMATIAVRNSSYARNKTYAEKYAQDGYEWLRNERDTSWSGFKTHSPEIGIANKYCAPSLDDSSVWNNSVIVECASDSNIPNSIFYRLIILNKEDEENITAVVRVYWNDSKGGHENNLTTTLSNWKPL